MKGLLSNYLDETDIIYSKIIQILIFKSLTVQNVIQRVKPILEEIQIAEDSQDVVRLIMWSNELHKIVAQFYEEKEASKYTGTQRQVIELDIEIITLTQFWMELIVSSPDADTGLKNTIYLWSE